MTLWQEYAAMRPFDGERPPVASDWGSTHRKAFWTEPFLLRQIEAQGKKVEEDLHWKMLLARERCRLPDQTLRIEYRSYEPKPKPDPRMAFVLSLLKEHYCEVCGEQAICRTSERWVCLNHLNAFNT